MAATKFDHEPLLPPGRHYLDLQDVYALGVDAFQDTSRIAREQLYLKAEGLIQRLLVLNIPCRVFIDGSFLTQKPLPDDIDLVVSIDEDVVESMGPYERNFTLGLNSNEEEPGLDVTVWTCYKRDSPLFGTWSNPDTVASNYGLEHSEQWAKGYAVVRLHETHVGLRICR